MARAETRLSTAMQLVKETEMLTEPRLRSGGHYDGQLIFHSHIFYLILSIKTILWAHKERHEECC